jgi:hypothetical protein
MTFGVFVLLGGHDKWCHPPNSRKNSENLQSAEANRVKCGEQYIFELSFFDSFEHILAQKSQKSAQNLKIKIFVLIT